MEIIFNTWLCFLLFHALLVTQTVTKECSETCVKLVLANKKHKDNVVEVNKDSYVNISFVLTTKKCPTKQDWLRVKVLKPGESLGTPICTFVFQKSNCTTTDLSLMCNCLSEGQKEGWMYKKVSRSDNSFKLELSTSLESATTQCLFVNVTGHSTEDTMTSGTLEIIGICCALGTFLVVVCGGVIFLKTRTYGGNTGKQTNHGGVIRYQASPSAETTEVIKPYLDPVDIALPRSSKKDALVRPADQAESSEETKYYEPLFPMDLVVRSLKTQFKSEA